MLRTAARYVEFARLVTEAQGYHLPMAMVFETRDDAPVIQLLQAEDYQEQLIVMDAVARDVERLSAEGVIFFGEMAEEGSDETELLVAVATDDGSRRQWHTPLERSEEGSLRLGETRVKDGIVPDFFSPVHRTWQRLGRASPRSRLGTA